MNILAVDKTKGKNKKKNVIAREFSPWATVNNHSYISFLFCF